MSDLRNKLYIIGNHITYKSTNKIIGNNAAFFTGLRSMEETKELLSIIVFTPPPIPDQKKTKEENSDSFSFNNKTYKIEELKAELEKGNHFLGKDSVIALEKNTSIKLRDFKHFDKVKQLFPTRC